MNTRNRTLALASLALFTGAWAFAQTSHQPHAKPSTQIKGEEVEGDEEEIITLDAAPAAVRAAAIKLAGDAKSITKVIKEEDDEDVVQYEIEYNQGAGASTTKCAAIFSAAGDLMETEKATAEADLPAAALAALRKDYPSATFADPQMVTKMYYEIDVVVEGKSHEVKVDASGNIKDESRKDNNHDEHAGDEHEEHHETHEGK